MRESCLNCVLKHLAQAHVLFDEAELGYPMHKYYALGHMAEAESESIKEHSDLATAIRQERLKAQEGSDVDLDFLINTTHQIKEKQNEDS